MLFALLLWSVLPAESTDIVGVYQHGIIFLRRAEEQTALLNVDQLHLKLSQNLTYPVGLARDPVSGTLFVSDLNNEATDIISLHSLNDTLYVDELISKFGTSTIESICYDPVVKQVLWTDSSKDGIYFSKFPPSGAQPRASNLLFNQDVHNPRGLTLDYCNRTIYWTERFQRDRTIKKYSLQTKQLDILKRAEDDTYYQAIHYDSLSGELIWAQTSGDDERNSSCAIMAYSASLRTSRTLASLQSCYPFSMVSDKDFIYWSDWSRGGIMRLSKHDAKSLVKIAHTPRLLTEFGGHNGAFGIEIIHQDSQPDHKLCSWSSSVHKLPSNNTDIGVVEGITGNLAQKVVGLEDESNSLSSAATSQNGHLHQAVILLSVTCIFFMTTTILLVIKLAWLSHHRLIASMPPAAPNLSEIISSSIKKSKKHRTFRPSKSVKAIDGLLCPRDSDDGVRIAIEDCCQMTLCETPCFTSMKKDDKSYKTDKAEDKQSLLQDYCGLA